MTLLLAGVGQTGFELLKRLSALWECHCVDLSEAQLDKAAKLSVVVETVKGDATSDLTLRDAGVKEVDVVVALANTDEENLEVASLSLERHGVPEVISVVRNPENVEKFNELGCQIVEKSSALATLLHNEIEEGSKVATGVGLGKGEIVEVQAMPTSRFIGRTLDELSPRLWHVAAIYRDGELIVPHGDSEIQVNDRLLLVGNPQILPSIADILQREVAHFPLQYGERALVLVRPGDPFEQMAHEALWIFRHSEIKGVDFLALNGDAGSAESLRGRLEELDLDLSDVPLQFLETGVPLDEAVKEHEEKSSYGLLIMPPPGSSFWVALRSMDTMLTTVSRATSKPLFISRGTLPLEDVLVPVDGGARSEVALQLALDIGHAQKVPVTAAEVEPPHFISHEHEERWKALERAREQGKVRQRKIDELRLSGNPVEQLVTASRDFSLLVLGVDQVNRLSYLIPDVNAWVAHRAECSILLVGHE